MKVSPFKDRDSERASSEGKAMKRLLTDLALGLLVIGCSARTLEVGKEGGGQDAGSVGNPGNVVGPTCTPDQPSLPAWPTEDACADGPQQTQFIGQWEGYVQGTAIDDEWNTFRLNITGANDTRVCGTLTFGTHTAPVTLPPVTDPNEMFPPASVRSAQRNFGVLNGPYLGVPYTFQNGQRDGQRITFQYTISEVFVQWCSMQSAYAFRNACSEFQCVPGGYSFTGGGDSPGATCQTQVSQDGPPIDVPCWKLELCEGGMNPVCICNASRCVAQVQLSELFDLTFKGDEATGVTGSSTVLFHRVYSTDN